MLVCGWGGVWGGEGSMSERNCHVSRWCACAGVRGVGVVSVSDLTV